MTATVPAEWKGSRVDFYWDTQSEATLWVDAKSVQGLNVTHGDRPDAVLIEHAKGGEQVDFQVEMACNQKFGVSTGGGNSTGQSVISPHHLRHAELVRFNAKAFELYYDALVLSKLEGGFGQGRRCHRLALGRQAADRAQPLLQHHRRGGRDHLAGRPKDPQGALQAAQPRLRL